MIIFSDLHLHSKYSRACSKNLDLENLNYYAKLKGLNLLITGDFTHPLWFKEISQKLEETDFGVYKLKNSENEIYYILGGEISSVFSRKNKVYRIHYIVALPKFEHVKKLNEKLSIYTNLSSDGRPQLGFDVIDFMKILFDIYEKSIFIPAHIWTPWYSLYGSMSGFDSIYDAFDDYVKYVTAVETGLSSTPDMNWRISELDNISIVSFSDSHSPYPHRIGREATIYDLERLNFENLYNAMKNPDDKNKIIFTIEFFPEEGKYHYDGHRACNIVFSPEESKKNNYICPNCGKKVTIGVMSRVEKLAKRPKDFVDEKRPRFIKTTPLTEIISQFLNSTPESKKVIDYYLKIIKDFGPELYIFYNYFFNQKEIDLLKLKEKYPEIYNALDKIKRQDIILQPGYDGVYGKVIINLETKEERKTLF